MREIKFRGRKPNGEWVYGDLVTVETTDGQPSKYNIRPYDVDLECPEDVEENTIGQFTGLFDKNGKEIYEGDILRGNDYPYFISDKGVYNYYAIVEWEEETAQFCLYTHLVKGADVRGVSHGVGIEIDENLREMEVIGNIHDNPELLNK